MSNQQSKWRDTMKILLEITKIAMMAIGLAAAGLLAIAILNSLLVMTL